MKRAPVETKTQAAGLAGLAAGVLVWVLQTYVVKGTLNPGLVSLIYAAVPGLLAFGAAYLAPHTPRPVPPAVTTPPPRGAVTVVDRPTGGITP